MPEIGGISAPFMLIRPSCQSKKSPISSGYKPAALWVARPDTLGTAWRTAERVSLCTGTPSLIEAPPDLLSGVHNPDVRYNRPKLLQKDYAGRRVSPTLPYPGGTF